MNATTASIHRTMACAVRGAGVPSAIASTTALAVGGGLADSGFGLVVADAGNPRRRLSISARVRAL